MHLNCLKAEYLFFFSFLPVIDLTNFSSGPISQMTPFKERGTSAYTNPSKIKNIPWK